MFQTARQIGCGTPRLSGADCYGSGSALVRLKCRDPSPKSSPCMEAKEDRFGEEGNGH